MVKMKKSSLYPGSGRKRTYNDENVIMTPTKVRPVSRTNTPFGCVENFKPVTNYKYYLEEMKHMDKRLCDNFDEPYRSKVMKHSERNIEKIQKKHEDYYQNHAVDVVMRENVRPVFTCNRSSVTSSGIAPFEILYERYTKYGKKIPLNEHIKALKALGAPRETLERVIINDDKMKRWQIEAGKVLDIVFAKYGKSKSKTKPKKKSMFTAMNRAMERLAISIDVDED